ncbi:MAG: ABC transporter ATP-binding protein [Alphaproteobacteria bacterium]|nr:ABC transporter ATP-binding protein [Alphaproteobacteria bacterium]MBV9017564.1 ABC transporter ATP-binding protein [Alphaproteobacteria bacterium]MBV9586269.1 ABC transporter ATP-binding protein [Alphaproteobacteria bacterium]
MPPLIEATSVSKRFAGGLRREGTLALASLSLGIHAGRPSVIAVVGESGSGKTTLARLLLGLAEPTSGEVRYRGTELRRLGRAGRRAFRRDVQAVFQDPYGVYNPFYRVDHVLTTPVRRFGLARSRSEARDLIGEALRAVGLRPEEILGRYPHQLSGGQRQRVMVARALLPKPKLIVADEPVSMVDASLRATILGSLRKLTVEHGISILYITHDLATAYQVSDTILVLYRAHLVEAGAVERVVRSPQHPYTQLLVSAIPRAHAARDWLAQEREVTRNALSPTATGCVFADRCPQAVEACLVSAPPLYRTESRRGIACVQYREYPALPDDALDEVLSP